MAAALCGNKNAFFAQKRVNKSEIMQKLYLTNKNVHTKNSLSE